MRKAAAHNLKFMAEHIPKFPEAEAMSLFQHFAKDDQDVVRFHSVDSILVIAQVVTFAVSKCANNG